VFLAAACLGLLASCTRSTRPGVFPVIDSDWWLKKHKWLEKNELWKEHDGGANVYIERGCLYETMTDYRHRSRPWTLRCSLFNQGKAKGARSLFKYYYDAIENEVRVDEPIGDATYLCRSPDGHAWILGFCKGRVFVEVSLVAEGGAESPQADEVRRALFDFARRLAGAL
jgi:hypothetical protein